MFQFSFLSKIHICSYESYYHILIHYSFFIINMSHNAGMSFFNDDKAFFKVTWRRDFCSIELDWRTKRLLIETNICYEPVLTRTELIFAMNQYWQEQNEMRYIKIERSWEPVLRAFVNLTVKRKTIYSQKKVFFPLLAVIVIISFNGKHSSKYWRRTEYVPLNLVF